ncbi:MAG: hypothetical protein ACKVJ6_03885, partial [Flavobacteriales bacterium]
MKYLPTILTFSLVFLFSFNSIAQTLCADGETEVIIEIIADNWPNEISWDLTVGGDFIAEGNGEGVDTLCVSSADEFPCYLFEIHDSYGDGINAPGGYWLYIDGVEIASGGNYTYGDEVSFECAPGSTCNDAVLLAMPSEAGDIISQSGSNFWYTFTPEVNGMYDFSSCGTGCDTKLYVYEYCSMSSFDNSNIGTIYYDDNQGGCGEEASQTMLLEGGVTYWIRWYSVDGCDEDWNWLHTFVGPPVGCTDEEACNYNPSAEIDS